MRCYKCSKWMFLRPLTCLLSASVAFLLFACTDPEQEAANARIAEQEAANAKAAKVAELMKAEDERCSAVIANAKAEYQKQFDIQDYSGALATLGSVVTVNGCSNDSTLHPMIQRAEINKYIKALNSKDNSAQEKLDTLGFFADDYPDEVKPFLKMKPALTAEARRDAKVAGDRAAKIARAEALRRKKEGVRLGMSPAEAIASSWGKPKHVNRTSNAYGTHEQWVYDGGYLYFEDGILTTVQN